MKNSNYTCPFCSHHSTVTEPDQFNSWNEIFANKSVLGEVGIRTCAIICPNEECQQLNLQVKLTHANNSQYRHTREGGAIQEWQLLPESQAKPLPEYVPQPIKADYCEACRIRDLSPKASATLSRRCLQGMIRDFFGISKETLKKEIDAIEDKVDADVWAAIDVVRTVGNIGAHMEKDINMIVDVEPNEAQLLIELIEQLIEDWYVARKAKEDRFLKITELAKSKEKQKES